MSTADIVLLVIVLIGAFSGYRQGFLMELFTFAALLLGVLGGFKLMGYAIVYLEDRFDIQEKMLPYVAFAAVFLMIVVLVMLLGKVLKLSIDKTFLGRVDQAAGAALGLLKACFLVSVSLWILEALSIDLPKKWTGDSWLLPRIETFAPDLATWVSDFVPFFKDVLT